MRLRWTLIAVLFSASCVVAACGPAAASPGGSTASLSDQAPHTSSSMPPAVHGIPAAELKAAVKKVLTDYTSKRPQAVCADMSPQAIAWMKMFIESIYSSSATCEQFVSPAFHPTEDDEGNVTAPEFQRLSIAAWLSTGTYGTYGKAVALVKVRYPGSAGGNPSLDYPHMVAFTFQRVGAKLLLAADPPMATVVAGGDPEAMFNLAPVDAASAGAAASVPAPSFSCQGAAQSSPDPTADVQTGTDTENEKPASAPWLDIRRVVAHGFDTSHPCLEIDLGAPVRPLTQIRIDLGGITPGVELAIGADGDSNSRFLGPVAAPFGERGSDLFIALDPHYGTPGSFGRCWSASSRRVRTTRRISLSPMSPTAGNSSRRAPPAPTASAPTEALKKGTPVASGGSTPEATELETWAHHSLV